MACVKLGSKPDSFKRQGQAWYVCLPLFTSIDLSTISVFFLFGFICFCFSQILGTICLWVWSC